MLLRYGHGRTFVAVPCYGQMPAASAFGLFSLTDCEIVCLTGNCHVDDARNQLVALFLEGDCEQLLFIDADVSVEGMADFLSYDEAVVGAAIPKKKDLPDFAVNPLPGPIQADERGLIEVFDVGTGVLKIQRHVLQQLFDDSPKYRYEDREVAEVFNRAIVDGDRLSGDLNFCRKWRDLGGKIFVDPEVRVSHTGEKTWQGTFGAYLRRANGLSLTRGIGRIRRCEYQRNDVVAMLEEWGNPYAVGHELLAIAIESAYQAEGPIIETGSGLTSLCMAATGAEVHALEHDPVWMTEAQREKERLGLDTLHLHYVPLVDYQDGRWYADADIPWESADIVLCDGPPRALANRHILYRMLQEKGTVPRLILQDDLDNRNSVEALSQICDFEIMGQIRKFAVIRWRAQISQLSQKHCA